ncbi:MAG: hypothetical protein KY391_05560 [Actinobacteria bacterium]|nr:hypothetical protein [Actinomycetota bacterium]
MGARLGTAPNKGPIRRFSYWFTKRRYKKVLTPVGIRAHDPYSLVAYGNFELAFERAKSVDKHLKMLAQHKAAQLIECNW